MEHFESQFISPTMNLLLVMVLVWTTGVVFRKIKQPPVLGELLAGIIFGPPILGIIQYDHTLKVLSELGVFFLMFYAGLETNPIVFRHTYKKSALTGLGGFVFPFFISYFVCIYGFQLNFQQSVFISLGLSITAIAVNARILNDLKLQKYRIMPVIIGASIIDDVLSFAIFSAIVGDVMSSSSFNWQRLFFDLLKVLLFFTVSIFIGIKLMPKMSKLLSSREAKGFTFSLIVALIFGILAELAGLHIILGAYMAGLFVREEIVHRDLFQKINDRFVAITYGFLGPIFFVSLSFHVTFEIFQTHLAEIIILLIIAILGKVIGAGLGAYASKMNIKESTVIGLAMNGRGAVELIIASIGLELGIIDNILFSILVIIAFVTTLIPPISLSLFFTRYKKNGLAEIS
ncbi:MAG: cation:proton antiporter [Spirochaetia bacterium]|nr:cation:proton antiporter [Spirochaetia bacterium]